MPSFCRKKFKIIQLELKYDECFNEIWNSLNFTNSMQNFKILTLLQECSICLLSLVKQFRMIE